jgi:hypothetical protein
MGLQGNRSEPDGTNPVSLKKGHTIPNMTAESIFFSMHPITGTRCSSYPAISVVCE